MIKKHVEIIYIYTAHGLRRDFAGEKIVQGADADGEILGLEQGAIIRSGDTHIRCPDAKRECIVKTPNRAWQPMPLLYIISEI
jgi:hypothetical protein